MSNRIGAFDSQNPQLVPRTGASAHETPTSVLPKDGACLLVAGATSSGKSTLLRGLIHELYTDDTMHLEFRDGDGEALHDPMLQGWVFEYHRGVFPKGTPVGKLQSFFIEFGQGRQRMNLSLCDMAGEDYQAILPTSGGEAVEMALDEDVEHILTTKSVKKLFVFAADATRSGEENSTDDRDQPLYEDMLFSAVLTRMHTLGLRRIRVLFVATKWDAVAHKNQDPRQFFKRKLPQTRSRLNQFVRANVQYLRYTVGQVRTNADGEAEIARHDRMPVRRLAQWIHTHGTGQTLKGYPAIRQSVWGRLKEILAS